MSFATMFAPDHARHDGVRPISIHLMRVFYFLIAFVLGPDVWLTIARHQGAWDPMHAAAYCMFASYALLSVLGLIHPLRMLPVLLFVTSYKTLWLLVVALPLWRAGTLAGSPAEEMARVFLWIPLLFLVVPWGYVYRRLVRPTGRARPA
jgi:hypothetical protein